MFEWNDYLAIMYAEMHRYSSGRISLNDFKKMVTTNDPYLKAFDRYSKLALEENNIETTVERSVATTDAQSAKADNQRII